jgi:hypothetical protein
MHFLLPELLLSELDFSFSTSHEWYNIWSSMTDTGCLFGADDAYDDRSIKVRGASTGRLPSPFNQVCNTCLTCLLCNSTKEVQKGNEFQYHLLTSNVMYIDNVY